MNKDEILRKLAEERYLDIVEKHMRSIIVMINKKRTGIPTVDDIRPIAVQNTMLKIVEMNTAGEIKEIAMKI